MGWGAYTHISLFSERKNNYSGGDSVGVHIVGVSREMKNKSQQQQQKKQKQLQQHQEDAVDEQFLEMIYQAMCGKTINKTRQQQADTALLKKWTIDEQVESLSQSLWGRREVGRLVVERGEKNCY